MLRLLVGLDSDGANHLMGPWELIDNVPMMTGRCSSVCSVRHRILKKKGRAVMFASQELLEEELLGLKLVTDILHKDDKCSGMDELYMSMLYCARQDPNFCIVHSNLHSLEGHGAIGDNTILMRDLAVQMANTLRFLHMHGILHMDIRPKSWAFSVEENLAKLGNFHAVSLEANGPPSDFHPYVQGYRSPELHCPLHCVRVSALTEAWALGATLVELASGMRMFSTMADVIEFAAFGDVDSNEAIASLRAPVQACLLRFFSSERERLSVCQWLEQTDFRVFLRDE